VTTRDRVALFSEVRLRAGGFLDLCDYFVVLGEAANVVFAPDLRSVDMNIENTTCAFD